MQDIREGERKLALLQDRSANAYLFILFIMLTKAISFFLCFFLPSFLLFSLSVFPPFGVQQKLNLVQL